MLAPKDSDYIFDDTTKPLLELVHNYLPLKGSGNHAIPIEGSQEPGYSHVYRNKAYSGKLKKFLREDVNTTHAVFDRVAAEAGDSPCVRFRPHDYLVDKPKEVYEDLTYRQVKENKDNLGAGILFHLQNSPYKEADKYGCHQKIDNHVRDYKSYDFTNHSFVVTLYSNNRYEWLLTDIACASYSITNTALYDTLGATASEYILELTQSPIVVCSRKHVKALVDLKRAYPDKLSHIISIISMDPLSKADYGLKKFAADNKIALNDIYLIMALGEMYPLANLAPSPETLYTISFTSGTTGANPKGVSLTHTSSTSCLLFYLSQMPITPDSFAFLPLAHIFERETTLATLASGGCVIFPQLNYSPLTLIEDLKLAKPTRISLVPRVLNKFEAAVKAATINNPNGSAVSKKIFNKVFTDKMTAQASEDGADGRNIVYDKFVTLKIKAQFGFDNLQVLIVGSAPIDPQTVKFLKASMQIALPQGYGTTEVFAGMCISPPFEATPGSVGATAINTEVKLREIPDMNYTANDEGGPRGELLIRGYQNFKEYYKNPEETGKAVDENGWYLTGDIARISKETGRIYIIDRVKNFFKLSQGEFISPEAIENNYQSNNPVLSQMFVHGLPTQSYLVGILGVDRPNVTNFLAKHCGITKDLSGLSGDELLKLINEKDNKRVLVETINKGVPTLKGFQKVQNVFIDFEPLTLERNVVTPTMKVKRPIAKKFFADILDKLYEEGPILTNTKL